jgi:hypothetical protein
MYVGGAVETVGRYAVPVSVRGSPLRTSVISP